MSDIQIAGVVDTDEVSHRKRRAHSYIPAFVYLLILYVIGNLVFSDPRAVLFDIYGYKLAWVEVLLLLAAIVAMAEQLKVAKPGVDNTIDAILMLVIAIVQIVLFALDAAKVGRLGIFNNTEFLMLTIINIAQTCVAFLINAATLRRSIAT